MASFNDPKLNNHIADDVPAIRQLLRSVAALDPATGNTDIPNGAKRLVETAQGYEFQSYNGTSWTTLEKWNIDVQKVDGYSASTGTTANTIPVRDADGKVPGDITGNAATATKANELSEVNPVAMGGTGAITAEQARNNLEVPPKSHASASTTYGVGTGGMYGHVKLSDYASDLYDVPAGIAATPLAVSKAQAEAMSEASAQLSSLDSTLRTLIAEEVAKYLPLVGGTMTAGITFAVGSGLNVITATNSDGYLQICGGGGYSEGASLAVYGKDSSTKTGAFACNTVGGSKVLIGYPDGRLVWDGENLVTSVMGQNADATGEVNGPFIVDDIVLAKRSVDNDRLEIYSGTDSNSGRVVLYGKSHPNYPSECRFIAGTTNLRILANGTGFLGGSKILTENAGLLLNSTNVKIYSTASATLPSGGTWAVIGHSSGDGHDANIRGTFAGGTKVSMTDYGGVKFILALKIAV